MSVHVDQKWLTSMLIRSREEDEQGHGSSRGYYPSAGLDWTRRDAAQPDAKARAPPRSRHHEETGAVERGSEKTRRDHDVDSDDDNDDASSIEELLQIAARGVRGDYYNTSSALFQAAGLSSVRRPPPPPTTAAAAAGSSARLTTRASTDPRRSRRSWGPRSSRSASSHEREMMEDFMEAVADGSSAAHDDDDARLGLRGLMGFSRLGGKWGGAASRLAGSLTGRNTLFSLASPPRQRRVGIAGASPSRRLQRPTFSTRAKSATTTSSGAARGDREDESEAVDDHTTQTKKKTKRKPDLLARARLVALNRSAEAKKRLPLEKERELAAAAERKRMKRACHPSAKAIATGVRLYSAAAAMREQKEEVRQQKAQAAAAAEKTEMPFTPSITVKAKNIEERPLHHAAAANATWCNSGQYAPPDQRASDESRRRRVARQLARLSKEAEQLRRCTFSPRLSPESERLARLLRQRQREEEEEHHLQQQQQRSSDGEPIAAAVGVAGHPWSSGSRSSSSSGSFSSGAYADGGMRRRHREASTARAMTASERLFMDSAERRLRQQIRERHSPPPPSQSGLPLPQHPIRQGQPLPLASGSSASVRAASGTFTHSHGSRNTREAKTEKGAEKEAEKGGVSRGNPAFRGHRGPSKVDDAVAAAVRPSRTDRRSTSASPPPLSKPNASATPTSNQGVGTRPQSRGKSTEKEEQEVAILRRRFGALFYKFAAHIANAERKQQSVGPPPQRQRSRNSTSNSSVVKMTPSPQLTLTEIHEVVERLYPEDQVLLAALSLCVKHPREPLSRETFSEYLIQFLNPAAAAAEHSSPPSMGLPMRPVVVQASTVRQHPAASAPGPLSFSSTTPKNRHYPNEAMTDIRSLTSPTATPTAAAAPLISASHSAPMKSRQVTSGSTGDEQHRDAVDCSSAAVKGTTTPPLLLLSGAGTGTAPTAGVARGGYAAISQSAQGMAHVAAISRCCGSSTPAQTSSDSPVAVAARGLQETMGSSANPSLSASSSSSFPRDSILHSTTTTNNNTKNKAKIKDSEDSLTLREVLMLTNAVDKARGISGNTNLNKTTGVADLRDLPPSSFQLRCGVGAAAGLDHTAVKGEQDQDQHQDASETNDSGVDHDCENDDTNKKMLESHDVRRRDPHAGPEPMQEDFRAAQGTLSIQSILHNRASSSSVASASLEVSSLSAVSAGPSHSIGSAVSECSIVGMLEVVDEHHRHQQQEHPPHLVVEPTPEHLTTTKATKTSATTATQPPVGGSLSTSTPSSSSSFSATAANAAATNAVMELQRLLQHASDDSVHDNPRYATTTTTSANTTTGLAAPSVVLTLHRPPPTRARCGRHANLIIKHSSPATPSTSPLNTNPTDTRFLSARGFCSTPQVFLSAALQLHPVANGEAVKSLAAGPPYQDAGSADTSGAGGMVHTPISIPTATTTAGSGDISFGTPSPSLSPSAAASHEPSFVGAVGTSAGSPAAREQEDSIVSSPSSSTTSLPPSPSPSMLAERKANECDCHRSVVKPTPTTRSSSSLPEGQEKDEVEQEQRRHTRRTALGCITPTPPVTPAEPTRTPHSEDHTTTTTTTAARLIDTAGGVVNTPPHSNPVVALDDMATTTATGQLLASSQCSCAREEDAKQGVSMEQEFLDDVDAMLTASDLEEMDKLFRCLYTIQYESASAGQATHI